MRGWGMIGKLMCRPFPSKDVQHLTAVLILQQWRTAAPVQERASMTTHLYAALTNVMLPGGSEAAGLLVVRDHLPTKQGSQSHVVAGGVCG